MQIGDAKDPIKLASQALRDLGADLEKVAAQSDVLGAFGAGRFQIHLLQIQKEEQEKITAELKRQAQANLDNAKTIGQRGEAEKANLAIFDQVTAAEVKQAQIERAMRDIEAAEIKKLLADRLEAEDKKLAARKKFADDVGRVIDIEIEEEKRLVQEFEDGYAKHRKLQEAQIQEMAAAEEAKRAMQQDTLGATSSLLGSAASAARLFGREGFAAYKAFAIAQAVISGAAAILQQLGQGDIYSMPFRVAAAGALAAVQIATIASASYAQGGLVPGAPSRRDNRLAAVATGEYIFDAGSVQKVGADWFGSLHDAIRRGSLDALPELAGLSPRIVTVSAATGGLVGAPNVPAAGAQAVNVALVNTRQDFRAWMIQEGVSVVWTG